MTEFSANLGFLWADLPLGAAIRAAGAAGFAAVECHWPYDTPIGEVRAALAETGLPMIGLNTARGDVSAGENGLSAVPGRGREARAAIDRAVDYARAVGARHVHVMAGNAEGVAAHWTFVENLHHACEAAARTGLRIVIEPLNAHDAPGYFLRTTAQAQAIIAEVGADTLHLMFDCYHVARTEGDIARQLAALMPLIGHIQFAGVPDRGPPDTGSVNFAEVFRQIARLGFTGPLGAEYRPGGATEASLGWMQALRRT
jgi:hydroxypyruvate isomerase